MDTSFANSITADLSNAFYYRDEDEVPAIQVGKDFEDVTFWLKYNDEDINKCASRLFRELGCDLGINNVQNAKEILLKFCTHAFDTLDADFLSLTCPNTPVSTIFSPLHYENFSMLFEDLIDAQKVLKPFVYTIRYAHVDGVHKINKNLFIFGSGLIEKLLEDMRERTGIGFSIKSIDNKYLGREPIGRYKSLPDSLAILIYARSINEAVEELDRLFGALCVSIASPFRFNQDRGDSRISYFDHKNIITQGIRSNLPSSLEISLNSEIIGNLKKLLSSPTKRMNSALSFIARGWTEDKRERFLNQFIALDALYGTEGDNKETIVGGVTRDACEIEDIEAQIKTIYEMRCKFVYGEIAISSNHCDYPTFNNKYGADPIESLFQIVRACTLNYQG